MPYLERAMRAGPKPPVTCQWLFGTSRSLSSGPSRRRSSLRPPINLVGRLEQNRGQLAGPVTVEPYVCAPVDMHKRRLRVVGRDPAICPLDRGRPDDADDGLRVGDAAGRTGDDALWAAAFPDVAEHGAGGQRDVGVRV